MSSITIIKSIKTVIHGFTATTPKQPQELSPLNPFIIEIIEKDVKHNSEINHVSCRKIPENKINANKISNSTIIINNQRLLKITNNGVKILP